MPGVSSSAVPGVSSSAMPGVSSSAVPAVSFSAAFWVIEASFKSKYGKRGCEKTKVFHTPSAFGQRLLVSKLSFKMLYQPLLNSLMIGFFVSFFAILLGSGLAWLMVRTDLPFKSFFSLAVIIPYMIPSWAKAQAWLTMFKTPRIGGTPGFMTSLGIVVSLCRIHWIMFHGAPGLPVSA